MNCTNNNIVKLRDRIMWKILNCTTKLAYQHWQTYNILYIACALHDLGQVLHSCAEGNVTTPCPFLLSFFTTLRLCSMEVFCKSFTSSTVLLSVCHVTRVGCWVGHRRQSPPHDDNIFKAFASAKLFHPTLCH